MIARQWIRTIAVGATSALVLGVLAIPAGSQAEAEPTQTVEAVSGHAYGMASDLFEEGFEVSVGPTPQVTLPVEGGGPFTDSLASFEIVPNEDPVTGVLEVSTEGSLGPDGSVVSSASVADFNVIDEPLLLLTAGLVATECSADLGSVSASTTILDGVTFDDEAVPESPAPNSVVVDETQEIPLGGGVLRLTLLLVVNEQHEGPRSITVIGARLLTIAEFIEEGTDDPELLVQLEATVAESHCGVVPAGVSIPAEPIDIVPRFTG